MGRTIDGTGAATPAPAQPYVPLVPTGEPPPPEISPLQQPVEIKWRLQNPFRFFTDPADTEIHRATYLALTPEQRKTPVLSAEHALSRRHDEGWAETMYRKTCWNDAKNRYVCPDRVDYINPKSHEVIVTLSGATDASVDCNWLTTPHGGESPRGDAISKPCTAPVEVDVPYPGGMTVSVSVGGREIASTEIKVRDILIVGMGDSFASGEGNPDVPVRFSPERATDYGKERPQEPISRAIRPASAPGSRSATKSSSRRTRAGWIRPATARSIRIQLRAALQLAVEDPHRAVTYRRLRLLGRRDHVRPVPALQGQRVGAQSAGPVADLGRRRGPVRRREARVYDLPEAYHMQRRDPRAARAAWCSASARREGAQDRSRCCCRSAATTSASRAWSPTPCWPTSRCCAGSAAGSARCTAIEEAEELARAARSALQGHEPRRCTASCTCPGTRATALSSPAIRRWRCSNDGRRRVPRRQCRHGGVRRIQPHREERLSSAWLADKLDQVMEQSAAAHGWSFVDGHRKAFIGRGLCAGHTDGSGRVADDLRLPRKKGNVWAPYNPAFFQPYAQRQRWFRTPNDAFMTGNFHVAGSVLQKVLKLQSLSWFQILLASTLFWRLPSVGRRACGHCRRGCRTRAQCPHQVWPAVRCDELRRGRDDHDRRRRQQLIIRGRSLADRATRGTRRYSAASWPNWSSDSRA